jgi:phenylacetic acid degradation operon negative regulatory protein
VQDPHPLIKELVALETLKTWSLIVTLFGDLDGTELSGTQIRNVLGPLGIKPEAIRVALHRLKTDGWITSRKQGREAIYAMSGTAAEETAAVAPEVYCKESLHTAHWRFVLFQEAPPSKDAVLLNRNLALVSKLPKGADAGALILQPEGGDIPEWIAASLVSDATLTLARHLLPIMGRSEDLAHPHDQALFRLLVVHHWRRVVLRKGSLAHAALVPGGEIAQCRARVRAFLQRFA